MSCWALQSDVGSHRTAGARTRLCTLRHMGLRVLRAASHPLRVTMLRPGEARRGTATSSPILTHLPPFDVLSIAGLGSAHLVWMRSLLRQPRPASWFCALVRRSGVSGAQHSGTEARQDAVSSAASRLPAYFCTGMCPRRDSSRTVHPGLWSARAHFPLVPTKDTWRREMGVVQSASCHIH